MLFGSKKMRMIGWIVFAVAMVAIPACLGLAEEVVAPTAPTEPTTAMGRGAGTWQYTVEAMGWVGVILICLSVAGLALIIEAFVNLRREKLIPTHVVQELEQLFEQEQYDQAIALCDAEDCFFARIMGAGLAKLGGSYEKVVQAMQEKAEVEVTKINQRIGHLALIGTIGPMFGLLGTVTGMIMAFNVIAAKAGTANPADLAYGISQALINTLIGLIVAIPVLTAYTLFKNKVATIVQEAGMLTGELLEQFRPVDHH
jgi:biopolymer transport protein ExbB